MKKLASLVVVSLLCLSGSALAQEVPSRVSSSHPFDKSPMNMGNYACQVSNPTGGSDCGLAPDANLLAAANTCSGNYTSLGSQHFSSVKKLGSYSRCAVPSGARPISANVVGWMVCCLPQNSCMLSCSFFTLKE